MILKVNKNGCKGTKNVDTMMRGYNMKIKQTLS